ncbi:interleukin-17 receptor A-like [Arapaima gigas]
MNLFIYNTVLFSVLLAPLSGLQVLKTKPLNCSGSVNCFVLFGTENCFDKNRIKVHNMTPTGPWDLDLKASVRQAENGLLVPVIVITWKIQTDGDIKYLRGTEVHVLKVSTNFNLCVNYKFSGKTDLSKKLNDWWSFSLDQVVVDPEEIYVVSVSNLPKPNIGHDSYYVARNITIPGCQNEEMQRTKVCIERGSLWEPSVNLTKKDGLDGRKTIIVSFHSEEHSNLYRVFVQCPGFKEHRNILKGNMTILRAEFDKCPTSCFVLDIKIQPFFIQCKNTCLRHQKTFNICLAENALEVPFTKSAPPLDCNVLVTGLLGVLLLCILGLCAFFFYRKQQNDSSNALNDVKEPEPVPKGPRKVLIIYSLDHPLYKDIVLKLCAFLQAQCGTEAVLDLLDSAQLSSMGCLQWLELQKERVEESSDKILILCSRGVQAKWQAMCGGQRVMLREDAHSPTGDMLTPAFNIIIPDLLHTHGFGKYVVAYFGGVCREEDVPSPFNITVKYKLMHHFEDVYLRILDKNKLEPWKINHVEGITENEYYKCPSGEALRDAIEAFQAYQLENPDWFEKECINNMEELREYTLQYPLLEETDNSCIFSLMLGCEDVPLNYHEVEIIDNDRFNLSLNAITNNRKERMGINEFHPARNSRQCQLCSLHPSADVVTSADMYASGFRDHLWNIAEGEVQGTLMPTEDRQCLQENSAGESHNVKNEEELQRWPNTSSSKVFPCPLLASPFLDTFQQLSHSSPREKHPCEFSLEEQEGKRHWSVSDQGYISRTSLQSESFSLQNPPETN